MPHIIRERHIDDICAGCKKPHGNHIEILPQHHKIYKIMTCDNCGYKTIKLEDDKPFMDRLRL